MDKCPCFNNEGEECIYYFDQIIYDHSLVDYDYQSGFLFNFVDEIKSTLENRLYLVGGITLPCVIEMAGREVLHFTEPTKSHNSTECFNYFLKEYMGYGDLIENQPKLYNLVRNGLVHEGSVKHIDDSSSTSFGAGYTNYLLKRLGIKSENIKGILIIGSEINIILDKLLLEFLDGVKRFKKDEIKNNWKH